MRFYAYLWLREDGTPYYAGKGKGKRAFTSSAHNVRCPKDESRIVVFDRDSEESAFQTEKELIANWGRKDLGTGCLRNFTDGGDGQSGRKFSKETIEKMRERMLGTKHALGHTFVPSLEQCQKGAQAAAEKKVGIFAPDFDRAQGVRKTNASLTSEERRKRAIKASHSIPFEQRILNGREGAIKTGHVRWHLNRGVISPSCKLCSEAV